VEWSKEELADYLVHQIVRCRLVSVFESNSGMRHFAEEVSGLAFAIYHHGNHDGAEDADAEAMFTQRLRDQRRENEIAAEEASRRAATTTSTAPAPAVPARRPHRKPVARAA
jgi:hypothetical protein